MRIYKLSASIPGGATSNNFAQLDIVEDGKLWAWYMSVSPTGMDALNDECAVEISFASSNSLNSNDTRQSIAEIRTAQNFLTSGGGTGSMTAGLSGLDIAMVAGERIFMHAITDTGVSGQASAYLYVKDGSGGSTRFRRNR